VLAQDALELGRQRRHRRPRALVASVGLELDPDALEPLESVLHQQQFGLDVDAAAPDRGIEPGPADLDHPIGGADRHSRLLPTGASQRQISGA
jgi:hypothetical protein